MQAVKWVVAKLQGDKTASFCKEWVLAKLQGDKAALQSSMKLYYVWISGPLRVSWPIIRKAANWPHRCRKPVALHSVTLRFPGFGGASQENRATPPEKGPVAPTASAFKGAVALQVASWKVSRYIGVSQLHCRLSRCSGACRKAAKCRRKVCSSKRPTKSEPRSVRPNGVLDGQNRQSPIASDFGSRTQIAALFAVLLYPNV